MPSKKSWHFTGRRDTQEKPVARRKRARQDSTKTVETWVLCTVQRGEENQTDFVTTARRKGLPPTIVANGATAVQARNELKSSVLKWYVREKTPIPDTLAFVEDES